MSYRNRVVAYTVAVVLVVAGAFFAIHRSMTGRLFRTGVDEPWHELADALASDPFVQARLLGKPGAGAGEGAAPIVRSLEPDERILGYVVVDPARIDRARRTQRGALPNAAVIDRMGRAGPDSAHLARELDQAIADSLAEVPDPENPETRRRGDVTVRVGAVALARPVPPPALARAGALAISVRRDLDTLSSRVLARFGAGHESVEGPTEPGDREALEALVSLSGALTSLESRVLMPASLANPPAVAAPADGGEGGEGAAPRMPEALAAAERLIAELAEIPGSLGERVDPAEVRRITARISGWIEDTDFQPGPTALVAAAFASPHLALFQQLARRYLWVSSFLVAAGVALGVAVARRTTEPLGRIQEGIERFARGDFAHRIDVASADVLASVAGDLNQMAERIAEGERARRLASMGLLVGGAAHELKNPVHALDQALGLVAKYHAELAASEPAATDGEDGAARRRRELTERITRLLTGGTENVERMRAILDEISAVQRVATDRREPRDLVADTRAAIDALAARWRGAIEVTFESPPALLVEATASLARIPQNLVSNAIAAVDEARAAGRGSRRVAVRLSRDGEHAVLTVDDDGAGVNPAVRERIFDLFFTTREVGRGTGLGLFLVHEIVAAHGGHVRCVSPGPLGGARFEVRVPLAASAAGTAT